ncbi:MAG: GNAT family N-acetyltransferase [Ilumatobacter sp.]
MELVGEGIVVREAVEADAPAIVEAVHASHTELAPWMPWATPDYDIDGALGWIRGEHGDLPPAVIVDSDGLVVGACSVNRFDPALQSVNLGYWVRTDRTGRGLAAKAARLVARHAVVEQGFRLVTISMSARNEASRRVAERAGAHFEGTLPGAMVLADGPHDAHAFTFVPGDF